MMRIFDEIVVTMSAYPALSLLGKGTVVLALALTSARLARTSRAAARHALLASAFSVLLALPVVSFFARPVPISVPVAAADGIVPPLFDVVLVSSSGAPTAARSDAAHARSGLSLPPLSTILLYGWLAGSVFFLIPIICGLLQVRTLRRYGLPWRHGQVVADELADARRVEVLLHESLPGPMTCGVLRPAIILPVDAQSWNEQDLERALVHELEHVRRYDWAVHCLARIACALYWFHPLVWMAWRRLALEAERSCDDAVLKGSEPAAYADQLVGLARRRRLPGAGRSPVLAMANRSDLAARIGALLDRRQARGRAGAFLVAASCIAATAIVLAMSPLRMVAAPQGETTPPDLHFDVASIKRSDPKAGGLGKRFSCDSKHCSARGIPLGGLAFDAYGLKEDYQMEADPSKLPSDRYDVEATLPDGTTIEQAHVMLQRLLAERFGLVVHRETRQLPGFRLTVAKGGPKLTKAVDLPASAGPDIVKKDGIPQYSNSAKSGVLFTIEAESIHGRHETMSGFVHQLVQVLRDPVVDATGIEGEYDYDLSFESIGKPAKNGVVYQGLQPAPQAGPALPPDPAGSDHPTIFTVIKQQLGLQLDSVKSLPVEVVVLDKANREPTGN